MPILGKISGSVVEANLWTPIEGVESDALTQIRGIASLPWVAHVAVMPDCHFGKGATVGSVIGMRGALSPAAVGVDLGCGMGAVKTDIKASDLSDNLSNLRADIEKSIPVGFHSHESPPKPTHRVPGTLELINAMRQLFSEFKELHPKIQDSYSNSMKQIGTLGGGNHFIEVCLDTESNVWLMLHSGSRRIGKDLAEIHMGIAKKLGHNARLPDKDLAVFLSGTPEMDAYRRDLYWAQRYAMINRRMMFNQFMDCFQTFMGREVKFGEPILCHHNYVAEEVHFGEDLIVTRKGAILASQGTLGIIPGSMGTKSYIVRGLGAPESLTSASHGAGRRMSRGAAKRIFTQEDLISQTKGVECRKDVGVLDEIPAAYKPIEEVMANQNDLVEIVAELKQVLCVKG